MVQSNRLIDFTIAVIWKWWEGHVQSVRSFCGWINDIWFNVVLRPARFQLKVLIEFKNFAGSVHPISTLNTKTRSESNIRIWFAFRNYLTIWKEFLAQLLSKSATARWHWKSSLVFPNLANESNIKLTDKAHVWSQFPGSHSAATTLIVSPNRTKLSCASSTWISAEKSLTTLSTIW